jgi:hypothetical protein
MFLDMIFYRGSPGPETRLRQDALQAANSPQGRVLKLFSSPGDTVTFMLDPAAM